MTDSQSITLPRHQIEALVGALDRVAGGELSERLSTEFEDPLLQDLEKHLNAFLAASEERAEEFHVRTMELAMGISECFQVLAEVRKGNLDARVSEQTCESEEELMAKLGSALNETVVDLRRQLDTIERQRYAIRELSTPVLQLWDGVLAMPIVGVVDTARSADIMERMLTEVVERQAGYVILDITGVEIVDTRTADYLIKVIKGAELLGAQCLLTGIQPAVAQTLVEIGVDLSSIRTLRNLQEGLRTCLRDMERKSTLSGRGPRTERA